MTTRSKPEPAPPEGREARESGGAQPERPDGSDDTAVRSLSREERARLGIDAWEPTLLRRWLRAQSKPRARRGS